VQTASPREDISEITDKGIGFYPSQ
jgi:hypothetical protein